jgi:hypothetical protein
VTLGRKEAVERIISAREPVKQPLVLSAEEVARLYGGLVVKPLHRGSFFLRQFLCSIRKARFFVPTHTSQTPSRAGAVKVGRCANVATRSIVARPHLDGPEHDGTLDVVGMTLSRGARLLGAGIAPHACIRRVSC